MNFGLVCQFPKVQVQILILFSLHLVYCIKSLGVNGLQGYYF